MTSFRRLALITVGLLLVLAPSLAGAAVRRPALVRGSTYLALGDSVTFGYEEPQVRPAPNYPNAASFVAYPEIIGRELRVRVVNPACPGETSASLINASAQSNGCENAYRKNYPLHVRYRGSQLAFAVNYLRHHRNVRLVSLMIGANDLFICQRTTPDHCLGSSQKTVLAQISRNVRRILTAVRRTARYRGQLLIENYFSLNYGSSLISGVSRALNAAQDGPGRAFGAQIGDGYGEFQRGARIFGGDPCRAGLITLLSTGGCGVHPTYSGQGLLAQAVVKAVNLG